MVVNASNSKEQCRERERAYLASREGSKVLQTSFPIFSKPWGFNGTHLKTNHN